MSVPSERERFLKEKSLQLVRGLTVSTLYCKKVIEDVLDFMPKDDDVILVSFPKTGTTWMHYIVHQILTKGESFPTLNDSLYSVVPHLEMAGTAAVEKLRTRPRFYRHHIPYDKMKKNVKAKIIYVYRKPEDTVVSFYHFKNETMGPNYVELDDYFEDFLDGNVDYGHYFDHIISYYNHKDDGNILFVSYEKLIGNKKDQILRIAEFIGVEYLNLFYGMSQY